MAMRQRVSVWCVGAALMLSGCGPLADVVGDYEGELELVTVVNNARRADTTTETLTLTERDGSLRVILTDGCTIDAELDGDSVTVSDTSCVREYPTNSTEWRYEGTGRADGDTLTLSLSGTFTRTYTNNMPPLEGRHTLTFDGARR